MQVGGTLTVFRMDTLYLDDAFFRIGDLDDAIKEVTLAIGQADRVALVQPQHACAVPGFFLSEQSKAFRGLR